MFKPRVSLVLYRLQDIRAKASMYAFLIVSETKDSMGKHWAWLTTTLVKITLASVNKIANRIRKLRDETEEAIDSQGRIRKTIQGSEVRDEIGDLSRSFANIVGRLGQYTHYLENMSSRLSHELRTPVAVVRSSLEHLSLQQLDPDTRK